MFDELSKWIDNALEAEIPDEVIAFGFNLYDVAIATGRWNWSGRQNLTLMMTTGCAMK